MAGLFSRSRKRGARAGWPELVALGVLAVAAVAERRMAVANPSRDLVAPGRRRGNPLDLSPRGWRSVAVAAIREFNEDRITATAGGVTFFCILALFPAMAAFVSLFGLIGDVGQARTALDRMAAAPPSVMHFVGDEMTAIAATHHGQLGVAFVVGVLISLGSANAGMKALIGGLNVAYEVKPAPSFLKLTLQSAAFTLATLVIAIGVFAGALWLPPGLLDNPIVQILAWPLLAAGVLVALAVLYRYGPSRARAGWRWVTPGSLAATAGWLAVSLLFSAYVSNFAHYQRTYGSLGAVIGFMTWMWLTITVVLFGAELNSEIEQRSQGR